MLASAPLRTCRYGGRSLALMVLKNAQLTRQSSLNITRSYSSEHAHHEARTESIRNIGIIAHVDAVSLGIIIEHRYRPLGSTLTR